MAGRASVECAKVHICVYSVYSLHMYTVLDIRRTLCMFRLEIRAHAHCVRGAGGGSLPTFDFRSFVRMMRR
jgi:hypothetical protein